MRFFLLLFLVLSVRSFATDAAAPVVAMPPFFADDVTSLPNNEEIIVRNGRFLTKWNIETQNQLRYFDGPSMCETRLALSTDGKKVACGYHGSLRLWDFDNNAEILSIPYVFDRPLQIRFSRDNTQIIVLRENDSTVAVFDIKGSQLYTLKSGIEKMHAMDISSDNKKIAIGGTFGEIELWDAEKGQMLWRSENSQYHQVVPKFSSDAKQLFFSHIRSNELNVIDASDGKIIDTLASGTPTDYILDFVITDDNKNVVALYRTDKFRTNKIVSYDLESYTKVYSYLDHYASHLALSTDDKLISVGREIKVRALKSGKVLERFGRFNQISSYVKAKERVIFSSGYEDQTRLYALDFSKKRVTPIMTLDFEPAVLKYLEKSNRLACWGKQGLSIINLETKSIEKTINDVGQDFIVSNDEKKIITQFKHTFKIIDIEANRVLHETVMDAGRLHNLPGSNNEIVMLYDRHEIVIWDTLKNSYVKRLANWTAPIACYRLEVMHSGKRIVYVLGSYRHPMVITTDVNSGEEVSRFNEDRDDFYLGVTDDSEALMYVRPVPQKLRREIIFRSVNTGKQLKSVELDDSRRGRVFQSRRLQTFYEDDYMYDGGFGSLSIWDKSTFKYLGTLYAPAMETWVLQQANGKISMSDNGYKYLYHADEKGNMKKLTGEKIPLSAK